MIVVAAFLVVVFALGASVGSFLNVVIYRVPLGRSVVRPSSRCPACERPIPLRFNVPILGWLATRGRCHHCAVPISLRYPAIELMMGLFALALFVDLAGGIPAPALFASPSFVGAVIVPWVLYLVFVGLLVAATFIDLDWFLLPNVITLPGIPLGLATSVAAGSAIGVSWQGALIGAAIGAGLILVIIIGYGLATGRAGMGGGDWKLLALIGAYLGWKSLPFVLFAASVQGLVAALVFRRSFAVSTLPPSPLDASGEGRPDPKPDATPNVPFRQLAVPFGPFLALAAVEFLFFRDELRALLASLSF